MKSDFPILNNGLAYLDNAATTQKPLSVLDALVKFYKEFNANPHRGVYDLSIQATAALEDSRKLAAKFIGANSDELFFVKNATEGFNYLSLALQNTLSSGDEIITTVFEHHSNFIPWFELSKKLNLKFLVANFIDTENNILNLVSNKTKIITLTHMSNVSGKIIDVQMLIKKIREKNKDVIIILDAAQSVAHLDIDVKSLDVDFLVFSAHKIYGPLGVGVVFGKKFRLENLAPALFGGGMVQDYKKGEFSYSSIPQKFEAGSIDVAGIYAFAHAITYFNNIKDKFSLEKKLQNFTLSKLREFSEVKIIGHDNSSSFGPVISFEIDGVHPHDFASIASSFGVCVRAGHHCAKPYLDALGVGALIRVSLSFYNDEEDILKLVGSIKKSIEVFK
ncbi:MAG: aminotransferase class V-fold PLP-dependent enzyme [Candidatus Woesearchaeota archaeon]